MRRFSNVAIWRTITDNGNPVQILGLPGYDLLSSYGANINLVIGAEVLYPISGAAPHRCCPSQLHKLALRTRGEGQQIWIREGTNAGGEQGAGNR
jgi:hypothetical protein